MTDNQSNTIIPNKFQDSHQFYLISEGPDGPIKAGRSINAANRLISLQTGNSKKLTLLAVWGGPYDEICFTEQIFISDHSIELPNHNRHIHGEWFDIDENLIMECMPDFFASNGIKLERVL